MLLLCESSKDYEELSSIASDFSTKIYSTHLEEALYYATLAKESYPSSKNTDHNYATLRFRLGYFYSKLEEYEKSNEQYLAIIAQGVNKQRIAQSYSELALYYSLQGDYFKAIDFYKKAISIFDSQSNYNDLVKQYINLSVVYHNQDTNASFLKKKEMLEKALSLESKTRISTKDKSYIYTGFATYYTRKKTYDFEKAIKFHKKNLNYLNQEGIDQYNCDIYPNISDLYIIAKKDSALYYIQKTINECPSKKIQAISKHHLSLYYKNRGELKKALRYIQESLSISTGLENKENTVLSKKILKGLHSKIDALSTFKEKGRILEEYFTITNDQKYLSFALDNILMADILIDLIEEETSEEKSRLHWRKEASSLYAQGVGICKSLGNFDIAFYFLEKNKALLLYSGVSFKKKASNFPDTFIIKSTI